MNRIVKRSRIELKCKYLIHINAAFGALSGGSMEASESLSLLRLSICEAPICCLKISWISKIFSFECELPLRQLPQLTHELPQRKTHRFHTFWLRPMKDSNKNAGYLKGTDCIVQWKVSVRGKLVKIELMKALQTERL